MWFASKFLKRFRTMQKLLFVNICLKTDRHVLYSICLCLRDNEQMEKTKKKIINRNKT